MMDIIKKQSIGTWISLGAFLLALIGLILYGAALATGMDFVIASGSQMFYDAARPEDAAMMTVVVTCGILALLFLVAAIVLAQFKFEGIVGKVCEVVVNALRIVAPALLFMVFLYFIYGSFTGLGWTFFSNAELEIYAQAKTAGQTVIVGLIFFIIAAIASIVAAFFGMVKKEQE